MNAIELRAGSLSRIYPAMPDRTVQKKNCFSGTTGVDSFVSSQDILQKRIAQNLTEQADAYLEQKRPAEAENSYKEAIATKEDYSSAYYGLAKLYKNSNNHQKAIQVYQQLLQVKPDEHEAKTLMGISYKKLGDYGSAKNCFQSVVSIDPKYDYAVRNLKEINNLILAKTNPALAEEQAEKQDNENLTRAIQLVKANTPQSIQDRVTDVNYKFGKTDELSGHQNIAQYEHNKRLITVTEDYKWAAPEVVAAYLVHENIHAADKDAITSVKEEGDAYNDSIEFWINNNNGIKDPELDYAAQLYKQHPHNLRGKVAEIYRSRDNGIPEVSPNHGGTAASTSIISTFYEKLDFWSKKAAALMSKKPN
jgi:tetratricopeptide (TPR) repeat protein